ncbi:MAG: response regulator transcription factor [Ignavibacteriae bacterium]|nr:DNA-binding response regulator [Ignavibacteriota bacterium]NOG98116.1 response regulator transcription factor [Ignavibacteriota bacterium]
MNKSVKILLVEDDLNLGSLLKEFLEVKGYSTTHCLDGLNGLQTFKKNKYDLCILDVMMPKLDGFSLAGQIRKMNKDIPLIFLTAKSMQADKIEGLKIGADDYITKPFSTEELFLRLSRILKRSSAQRETASANENVEFKIGNYLFNYKNRMLKLNDKAKRLTSKESELLKLLCEHNNKLLERTTALNAIWKENTYFTSRSMDVYIAKLRSYLKEDSSIEIANVHGLGFKLIF